MTKVQWDCKNCATLNPLLYDETEDGQHTCSCKECGAPALYDTVAQDVIMIRRGSDYYENMSSTVAPPPIEYWRV
jgi:predicted nucleic acid-binding Zn ribbon protein